MMDHAIIVHSYPAGTDCYNPPNAFRSKFNPEFQKFQRLESSETIKPRTVYISTFPALDATTTLKKLGYDCFIAGYSYDEIMEGKLTVTWGGVAAATAAEDIGSIPKFHRGGVIKGWPKSLMGEPSEVSMVGLNDLRVMAPGKPVSVEIHSLPGGGHIGFAKGEKDTNPKDAVGVRKWRQFTTVSHLVLAEVGVGMLEGARKYGRHNYRVAGVRASVYVDAAMGHIGQWWEGEDIDKDSGLSHIAKAICSLFVLRDAMIQDMLTDDRPPKGNLDAVRDQLQAAVDEIFTRHPDAKAAYTELDSR